MASRVGAVCLVGLIVGCAAATGSGCSDDNSKKVPFGEAGDGGEAGETGGKGGTGGAGGKAGAGGSVITPEGGAAGEAPVGQAGQGGAAPIGEGGAAGAEVGGAPTTAEGGAGGALAMCVPLGSTSNLNLNEGSQKVCRGAIVSTNFNANDSSTQFTCCGTGPFDVPMTGVTLFSGDGSSGNLLFTVPANAPIGLAQLSTTCAGGASRNTFDVEVTTTLPPNVEGLEESSIFTGDTLMVDGTNLSGVTSIEAVSADGSNVYPCSFDTDAGVNDLDITCSFDGIQPGDYFVVVQQADCGAAVNQPSLTVKQAF